MELKNFIEESLRSIIQGVRDVDHTNDDLSVKLSSSQENRTVEFDIAVTTEAIGDKNGGMKIQVFEVGSIGGKISKRNSHSEVTRLKFGVSIGPRTRIRS